MSTEIPEAAVQAVAERMFRRYESQYSTAHLSWRDFTDDARADLEAAAPLLAEAWGVAPDGELRRRFGQLKRHWHAATSFESNIQHIIMDLSYQQIIGLGPRVIPLILEDLAEEGCHWFWALTVLTGSDKARGETTIEGGRQAWLRWGREHGFLAAPVTPEEPSREH